MTDMTILENGTSRNGNRRLHVMQMNEPVDLEALTQQWVPEQSRAETYRTAWDEGKKVKRCYARLQWPCREAVELVPFDGTSGTLVPDVPDARSTLARVIAVMWKLGKDDDWLDALRSATETYWGYFDCWPDTLAVHESYAAKGVEVKAVDDVPLLRVMRAKWAPQRCVVVFRNGGENVT